MKLKKFKFNLIWIKKTIFIKKIIQEKEREKENNLELEKYIQEREEQLRDSLGIHFYFYNIYFFLNQFLPRKTSWIGRKYKIAKI